MSQDAVVLSGIVVVIMLVLLLSGLWVAVAMGLVGVVVLLIAGGSRIDVIGLIGWNMWSSFVLTAIPMYMLMGEIIRCSGMGEPLYNALTLWTRRIPGGLVQTNILGCTIFAAMAGASTPAAATFSTLSYKEMIKRGYPAPVALGSTAGPAMLGILIPPSIPMVIYGEMTGTSVSKLFMAGVIPGLLFAGLMIVLTAIRATVEPGFAPRETVTASWTKMVTSLKDILPFGGIIFIVLGGIYLGWATPTEAGAVGAASVAILALAYRRLSWKVINEATRSAVRTTCLCLLIVFGAQILAYGLVSNEIPRRISQIFVSLPVSPPLIMIGLYVLYLIMGCFLDGLGMMLLTLPVVYPAVVALGYDPIWFGIALVVTIEIGLITPPFAFNIFVVQGATGEPMEKVVVGILPYVLLGCVVLAIITAWPQVALWLPRLMQGT